MVAPTTGGEFVLGHKTVAIEKPVLLQGGLGTTEFGAQPLIAAVGGEPLSKTPETVPGGLVGIAGLGGEVTATAELAGPPSSAIVSKANLVTFKGAAVTLPLKVKLSNETLGEECYIGSDAEPIVLHLTTGETAPPAGTNRSGAASAPRKASQRAKSRSSGKSSSSTTTFPSRVQPAAEAACRG